MFLLPGRNNKNLSDEELLEKYRSTEDMSFLGDLYSRYMHLVYGLCLKYLSGREEARDAVLDIFGILPEKVIKHEIRHFKSWLYVLSKNYCLMQIRAGQAREKRSRIWSSDFMENEQDVHPIDSERGDMNEALMKCIEKLKKDQKKCIELFYYDNRCYREIAKIMKISEKKVKSNLQNGKRNLKICLEQNNVKEK